MKMRSKKRKKILRVIAVLFLMMSLVLLDFSINLNSEEPKGINLLGKTIFSSLNEGRIKIFDLGEPFYSMKIESVEGNSEELIINTTGATYILSKNKMELWRRIDPATNTINSRKVSEIIFDKNIGDLAVNSINSNQTIITSSLIDFEFNSDSFFLIKAKSPITLNYTNLIEDAEWNKKGFDPIDRIWTDGYGGSLHAIFNGTPQVTLEEKDKTIIEMQNQDITAFMVFPARFFDFERLYGESSRPFVQFIYSKQMLEDANFTKYEEEGFGTFVLWNRIYDCNNPDIECSNPVLLDSGFYGYKVWKDWEELVRQFIIDAHENDFKVVWYSGNPSRSAWQNQNLDVTLNFYKEIRQDYGFDGWYFDSGHAGNLSEDYYFIKKIRKDVGEQGIIFHHDSVDNWANPSNWRETGGRHYNGLRAIMINTHVDYTVTGETGSLAMTHSPSDPYFRYFASGYGTSQAFGSQIIMTNGSAAITEKEKYRIMADLNSAERNLINAWTIDYKPYYERRKQEYLSENFNPDVNWPPAWFKEPKNVQVQLNEDYVTIYWETEQETTGEVLYTKNGRWRSTQYSPEGAAGSANQGRQLSKNHLIRLENLEPNKTYQFRIRSTDLKGLDEIIWGHVGNFTTGNYEKKQCRKKEIPCQTCNQDLIAYWSFDEMFCDNSLSAHDGFLFGPTYKEKQGHNNTGTFDFKNTYSDYILLKNENSKQLNNHSYYGGEFANSTITAWIKINNNSKYNVVTRYIGGFDYLSVGTSDLNAKGKLRTMVYDSANNRNRWPTSSGTINESEWTHIAFVFEGGARYKFYINGNLDSIVENQNLTMNTYDEKYSYLGGGFSDSGYFDGLIDELMVFNSSLTTEEICLVAGGINQGENCSIERWSPIIEEENPDKQVQSTSSSNSISSPSSQTSPINESEEKDENSSEERNFIKKISDISKEFPEKISEKIGIKKHYILLAISAFIAIIIFITYKLKNDSNIEKKNKEKIIQAKNLIYQLKNNNFSNTEIKKLFKKHGWTEKHINQVMKEI